MAGERRYQIGEFADLLGLSIATVRHYGELGIVAPSGRSPGGFRLYTDADVARFRFVKLFKPLGFKLDEVRQLMSAVDRVDAGEAEPGDDDVIERYAAQAERRWLDLQQEVEAARRVADNLRDLRSLLDTIKT